MSVPPSAQKVVRKFVRVGQLYICTESIIKRKKNNFLHGNEIQFEAAKVREHKIMARILQYDCNARDEMMMMSFSFTFSASELDPESRI